MRKRPGEESDESDEEVDLDEQALVPFEKAIVGFFFSGFFMVILMLVGLTKVRISNPHAEQILPVRSPLANLTSIHAVLMRVVPGIGRSWRSWYF